MNKKLLTALILVVLCVLLVFLGVRHDKSAPAGSSSDSGETSGQVQEQEPAETPDPITATLAVCGDVMSHSPQTNDAYDAATDTYSYLPCFQYVKPWIESADYAVANFETTLNGPPFRVSPVLRPGRFGL